MRLFLTILMAIHGIIHLFGFLKAFNIVEIKAISDPISKPVGIAWLLAFILFTIAIVMFFAQYSNWWLFGLLGIILSQGLIFAYWSDAKFGTILNLIFLLTSIIGYYDFSFHKNVDTEILQMLAASKNTEEIKITAQMIEDLPSPVQRWLMNSGMVGKEKIERVFLEQEAKLMLKPEQKEWTKANAKQYFTIDPPAFNWSVNLNMQPGIKIVGRDKFENGKAEMVIKPLAIIPMVDSKNNDKVNQAALQRYLAETVWFPSAALSPYITWRPIDEYAAEATMAYNGTVGSGIFHFDKNGDFKNFKALRYKDPTDIAPLRWTVTATKIEKRNGIRIPVEAEATWELENENWTWLKVRITKIVFNMEDEIK